MRLLKGLLLWTALTTMVFWLPFVRGLFDGASYQWGGFGFSGRGIAGDYWFVATASLLAIALQYLAWRGPRAAFYALFGGWHVYRRAGAHGHRGGAGAVLDGARCTQRNTATVTDRVVSAQYPMGADLGGTAADSSSCCESASRTARPIRSACWSQSCSGSCSASHCGPRDAGL